MVHFSGVNYDFHPPTRFSVQILWFSLLYNPIPLCADFIYMHIFSTPIINHSKI